MSKIIIAFVLVAAFGIGTFYMYYEIGLLKGTESPAVKLTEVPKEIGSWKEVGEKEINKREFRAIQACEAMSREYTNLVGKKITCHMAIFNDFWNEVPHSPMVCYPSSGWTKVQTEPDEIEVPGMPSKKLKALFVVFEREGRREMVMFWYQFGDITLYDTEGLQKAQGELRDCEQWPSLIKVLLQTNASNTEQAKKRLIDFSTQLYTWTSKMQKGDPSTQEGDSLTPKGKSSP